MIPEPPAIWSADDRGPLCCREKLKVLAENRAELARMQDTSEDLLLMGADEIDVHGILAGMIQGLESPKRAAP